MQLKHSLYGALALTMMAACSDRDFSPSTGGESNATKDGVGYLGISLELPSEAGTRGVNDQFDDGLKIEYTVDHAAVLLFRGATEGTARFVGAFRLDTDEAFDQPNGDNVTLSFQKAIKVLNPPAIAANENLYGLAIVNYSRDIFQLGTEDSDNDIEYGDLIVKDADGTLHDLVMVSEADEDTPATTFDDFRLITTASSFIRTESGTFFMTNAPLSNKPGMTIASPEGANIQTLAKLNITDFHKTEAEAIQNPAGCIFVERAVAKITCSQFPKSVKIPYTSVKIDGSGVPEYTTEEKTLTIASVDWALDNEEQTSYIVRNTRSSDPFWGYRSNAFYRFVGSTGMNDNTYDSGDIHLPGKDPNFTGTWYRTYWGIDPHYDINKDFNNQASGEGKNPANYKALSAKDQPYYTSVNALYPRENTFSTRRQQYKNTTRVIFKVKYTAEDNQDLYAVRGQLQTFYFEADANNLLLRSVLGSTRLHDLILKYKKDNLAKVDYTFEDLNFTYGIAQTADADEELGIVAGDYILKTISFKDAFITTNFKTLTAEDRTNIANELKQVAKAASGANHIVPFTDNTCYYAVYVQHFGDTYCPLPEGWIGETVGTVYENSNPEKYLGRYGLVRNNWYDLTVTDIKNLGNARVPNGNVETSDDNKTDESYLAARVHVLSWAKRTQNIEF